MNMAMLRCMHTSHQGQNKEVRALFKRNPNCVEFREIPILSCEPNICLYKTNFLRTLYVVLRTTLNL
jgi:hypothetical protein